MRLIQTMILSCFVMFSMNSWANTFDEIQQQAEQGDALAQAKMGAMYQLGRNGATKNVEKSAKWMLKAANQGLVEAEVFMAALYDRGLGVKQSVNTATQWYEKAAAQNHGTALAILGRNDAAKGSVAFNYKAMRLRAAKQIPVEYSKRFLRQKL
ncbi:tetratricopeptide repeat protein [Methyloprofundus sp.]|uniref:tetratricopeptide repeat protein n=1 Tax=Methyloprofundus sp. TaxID=2020875 RepID=UPI003D0F14E2